MPLLPAIDSDRPGVASDNLVVGNWPLPRAFGIANISYKVGHLAEAKCKMVIQNALWFDKLVGNVSIFVS